MANNEQLISLADRSPEERRRIAIMGANASNEKKRKKKSMRQAMELMLSARIPVEQLTTSLKALGFTDEDINAQQAIVYTQVVKAIKGDTRSAEFCRDTVGEFIGADNKEEQEKQIIAIPAKDIAKDFIDLNRMIDDRDYREYYLEGGRGSTKSSFISEKIIELIESNQNMCCVVVRQVFNTLKDSVFSQLEWAIDKLSETYPELHCDYKVTKSPLEITKISTGQKIYFRGADDYGKIKSIKPPANMYIGITWYEEFDQLKGMTEVRKINQSLIRGGEDYIQFYSYNTPASTRHFVNVEKRISKETRLVHKSCYLNVPVKWLGTPFFEEASFLKKINERLYLNEYMGEETGTGGNVFENIELRNISDDEINTFGVIYMGIDWGYFPDPFAWTKMHYNPNQKVLYIFDEFTVNKMSNQETWNVLVNEKKVTTEDIIIADSAEPKSIGDYKTYGACIHGAEKGPDSVNYSMKWLSSLAKIVIDPNRCPVSADEFSTYEYEQDKDENYISGYPDESNHCIDSVRYALNKIWKKKGL